ncbi:MAG: hypothetical protein Q4C49_05055, partial [Bacillota bacterium]|nr:hypothetical protein [Bacillota bacterium]
KYVLFLYIFKSMELFCAYQRRKQLSTTALPFDYEVYATYETSGNLEDKKLHKLIDNLNPDLRISKSREFFFMSAEDAYELLEAIAKISDTLDKLTRVKKVNSQNSQTSKRPAIDFFKCGLKVGDELVCTLDPSVVVVVESEHKVIYNEELTSLSAIAKSIKGYSVAGPMFFTFNGELLVDIAERTQWK